VAVMELEEAGRGVRPGGAPTSTSAPRSVPAGPVTPTPPAGPAGATSEDRERSRLAAFMAELDTIYAALPDFPNMEPDQVLLFISGWLARLTGIRAELQRSGSQKANMLRTKEVDPLIEALDSQFKIHSRLISMRELDFKMTGPQT
jgi:hypothetical protein